MKSLHGPTDSRSAWMAILAPDLRLQERIDGTHYPIPSHLQPTYAGLGFGVGAFPISKATHREVLSVPMGPHLLLAELDRAVVVILAVVG